VLLGECQFRPDQIHAPTIANRADLASDWSPDTAATDGRTSRS
jgi:hypothetical protein